ncbi:MAG: hypothetical protein LAN64_10365 [Acidobacteriia bacterium]|nr:hypothetical protein [Terriglobia bacterium]
MKLKIATGLMALLIFAAVVPLAKSEDKDSKKTQELTGCLQKGSSDHEFKLTANDGSTWELKSDDVNLGAHVGHEVTVKTEASKIHAKAHEMKEGAKEEMQEHGMAKNATERGHLTVTNLTMIRDTCSK